MLPLLATTVPAPITPSPVIIATNIPGNNALRVPPDNVPPTVSNVQINNNAKGGNTAAGKSDSTSAATAAPSQAFSSFIPLFDGTPTTLSLGAKTTFLTQLLSQDNSSPQTKIILTQYEKLLSNAQVKYKPSNATLPQPEPANIFGKLVQQQKQAQPTIARATTKIASTASPVTVPTASTQAAPAKPIRSESQNTPSKTPSSEAAMPRDTSPISGVQAIGAYIATLSRNEEAPNKAVRLV